MGAKAGSKGTNVTKGSKGSKGNKDGGCKAGDATITLNPAVYQALKEGVDNATEIPGRFGNKVRICLDCGTLGKVLTAFVQANQTDCKKKKKKKKGKGKGKKGGKGG